MKGVHPLNTANVAGCTYCWPQVASVGMTEAKARESGRKIKVGKFPFIGNGKAIALGEAEGLIKTVFDAQTGELLGAHMNDFAVDPVILSLTHHVAEYSALLMNITEGKCYSLREMGGYLADAGFDWVDHQPTAVGRSFILARRN